MLLRRTSHTRKTRCWWSSPQLTSETSACTFSFRSLLPALRLRTSMSSASSPFDKPLADANSGTCTAAPQLFGITAHANVLPAQPQRRSCTVLHLQRGAHSDHRGLYRPSRCGSCSRAKPLGVFRHRSRSLHRQTLTAVSIRRSLRSRARERVFRDIISTAALPRGERTVESSPYVLSPLPCPLTERGVPGWVVWLPHMHAVSNGHSRVTVLSRTSSTVAQARSCQAVKSARWRRTISTAPPTLAASFLATPTHPGVSPGLAPKCAWSSTRLSFRMPHVLCV